MQPSRPENSQEGLGASVLSYRFSTMSSTGTSDAPNADWMRDASIRSSANCAPCAGFSHSQTMEPSIPQEREDSAQGAHLVREGFAIQDEPIGRESDLQLMRKNANPRRTSRHFPRHVPHNISAYGVANLTPYREPTKCSVSESSAIGTAHMCRYGRVRCL